MTAQAIDAALIVRAKAADTQALTTIYERYSPAIYRYIYHRVNDAELAEDLRADVFLQMLKGIERYEDRGWPISAWLYRIAHDRVIDVLRRRHIHSHVPLESRNATADGPETIVSAQLDYEELHRSIERLTDQQRNVIQMRFLQDMSIHQTAQALGCTTGAVKALQCRGVRALQRYMTGEA